MGLTTRRLTKEVLQPGVLKPGVLTTRDSYHQGTQNQESYKQVFLPLGVLTTRGLRTKGS